MSLLADGVIWRKKPLVSRVSFEQRCVVLCFDHAGSSLGAFEARAELRACLKAALLGLAPRALQAAVARLARCCCDSDLDAVTRAEPGASPKYSVEKRFPKPRKKQTSCLSLAGETARWLALSACASEPRKLLQDTRCCDLARELVLTQPQAVRQLLDCACSTDTHQALTAACDAALAAARLLRFILAEQRDKVSSLSRADVAQQLTAARCAILSHVQACETNSLDPHHREESAGGGDLDEACVLRALTARLACALARLGCDDTDAEMQDQDSSTVSRAYTAVATLDASSLDFTVARALAQLQQSARAARSSSGDAVFICSSTTKLPALPTAALEQLAASVGRSPRVAAAALAAAGALSNACAQVRDRDRGRDCNGPAPDLLQRVGDELQVATALRTLLTAPAQAALAASEAPSAVSKYLFSSSQISNARRISPRRHKRRCGAGVLLFLLCPGVGWAMVGAAASALRAALDSCSCTALARFFKKRLRDASSSVHDTNDPGPDDTLATLF